MTFPLFLLLGLLLLSGCATMQTSLTAAFCRGTVFLSLTICQVPAPNMKG